MPLFTITDWLANLLRRVLDLFSPSGGYGNILVHFFFFIGFCLSFVFVASWPLLMNYFAHRRWARMRLMTGLAWATERNLPFDPMLAAMEKEAWDGWPYLRFLGWRRAVAGIRTRLLDGVLLADACWPWRRFLGANRLLLLREAERRGRLGDALRSAGALLREEDRAAGEAREVLVYPCFMLLFMVGFVFIWGPVIINTWFVSNKILMDLHVAAPPAMRVLTAAATFMPNPALIALVVVPIVIAVGRRPGRGLRGGAWMHLPVIGGLIRLIAARNFCETLAVLAGPGAPLPEALRGAAESALYTPYRRLARWLADGIERGEGAADLVRRDRLLPAVARELLVLGLRAGDPASACRRAADHLTCHIDVRRRALRFVAGAAIVAVAGALVGFMAYAVFGSLVTIELNLAR